MVIPLVAALACGLATPTRPHRHYRHHLDFGAQDGTQRGGGWCTGRLALYMPTLPSVNSMGKWYGDSSRHKQSSAGRAVIFAPWMEPTGRLLCYIMALGY